MWRGRGQWHNGRGLITQHWWEPWGWGLRETGRGLLVWERGLGLEGVAWLIVGVA